MSKLGDLTKERNQAMFRLAGIQANVVSLIKKYRGCLTLTEEAELLNIVSKLKVIKARKHESWKKIKIERLT